MNYPATTFFAAHKVVADPVSAARVILILRDLPESETTAIKDCKMEPSAMLKC